MLAVLITNLTVFMTSIAAAIFFFWQIESSSSDNANTNNTSHASYKVPSLVGRQYEQVQKELKVDHNWQVVALGYVSKQNQKPGAITDQTPLPNTLLQSGGKISVHVERPAATPPEPSAPPISKTMDLQNQTSDRSAIMQNPAMSAAIANTNSDKTSRDNGEPVPQEPKDAVAYCLRAKTFLEKGDADQAIRDYTQGIRLAPINSTAFIANAYFARGMAYMEKRDYNRAVSDFTEIIQLLPNNSEAYYNRATAYHLAGRDDLANADYAKSLQVKAGGR